MKKIDPLFFWKKYELIASTKTIKGNETSKPKICRFCGKNESTTTFNTKAHILPELLGRNDIISGDECDNCNNKFSAFESHLSIFFRPHLAITGVEGKRKVPKFHSRTIDNNEETRTTLEIDEEGRRKLTFGNIDDYKIDKENKKGSIIFRMPPHKPIYVYKALLKIALSILPEDRKIKYKNVFDWISDKDISTDYFCIAFITVLRGKKFAAPIAELYEAKQIFTAKDFIPELTLIVKFGNIVAQIFLPLSHEFDYERSKGKSPSLNVFPASTLNIDFEKAKITNRIKYSFTSIDLRSEESVSYNETMHFTFKTGDFYADEADKNNDIVT